MLKKIFKLSNSLGLRKAVEVYIKRRICRKPYKFYFQLLNRYVELRPKSTDFQVFNDIFIERDYEHQWNISKGIIIDAGAYAGFSTLYFHLLFPSHKIIALEPDPDNFNQLLKNVTGISAIKPIQKALWHTSGPIYCSNPFAAKWGHQYTTQQNTNTQNLSAYAISILDLMKQFNTEHIALLKLDVEGAEKDIFEKNTDWIRSVDNVAIELHDRFKKGCSSAVNAQLCTKLFRKTNRSENTFYTRRKEFGRI